MTFTKALALLLCLPVQALADTQSCIDPLFQVRGEDAKIVARVCQVASATRPRLANYGVTFDKPIDIEIAPYLVGDLGPCLGIYHCGVNRIEILTPKALAENRDEEGAFALIPNEAYWESVLVHELAHAGYDRVACPFSSCVVTSEYVAYVMQVLSLSPNDQALLGKTIELSGEPRRDVINAPVLYMASDHFAKYAWLYFKSQEDSSAHMKLILDGRFFFDIEISP